MDTLKRAMRNVCFHYRILGGEPEYAAELWRGRQQVVLAGRSGILAPAAESGAERRLRRPIRKGQALLAIRDLFGEPVEELTAPCDGVLFGFRTYPSTTAGDWTLFCGDAEFVGVAAPPRP